MISLILDPLATGLPEKVNSVLWVRDGKGTLGLGNIASLRPVGKSGEEADTSSDRELASRPARRTR